MKLRIPILYLFFLAILFPSITQAQRMISGTITDSETKEALIGANVLAVGTSVGTITDVDGNYSLQVPEGANEIIVSYVGYTDQTLEIGTSGKLDVQLLAGTSLGEVILIGYGTVKKDDATGSVQTVDESSFNKGAITSPQELLAGKIAGVQITTGGDPGGGSAIRIRGGSSLSASNNPLVVIDGVPIDDGSVGGARNALNIVNPNDIETFTVLKDASATAIYGSRASNGVIIITTKKGKLGKKLRLNYSGNISVSQPIALVDVLDAPAYSTLINERFEDGHPAIGLLGTENTNWQNEIYQSAIGTDHNISAYGGVGIIPYRVSLGYTNKDGILKTDNFNRTSASVNLSPGFLENTLQVNVNLKAIQNKNTFANRGAIGNAAGFNPTQPVFSGNENFGGYFTPLQANGDPITIGPSNPIALLEQISDISTVNQFIGNIQIDYRMPFLPALRANLNVGYDYGKGVGSNTVDEDAAFAFTNKGSKSSYENTKTNRLLDFYLNYDKKFGAANLDLMAGYSWQHFYSENSFSETTSFDGTNVISPAGTNAGELYLLSLFGRANVSISDRYFLTFTLRRDGSSRFSPENRWGLFPAAGLAWKVIDTEPTSLKLRLGYGVTGQQNIGGSYYNYLSQYSSSTSTANYQLGDEFISTLRPEGYDENIKWEETTTYNVGLDYGLFKDRINGSFEVYRRISKDLLNFVPVPAGSNLTNQLVTNVGNLENTGFEFSINTVAVQKADLRWDLGFNFTLNKNEITKLTASDNPDYQGVFTGGISGGVGNTIQIHSVGSPANSFFVYEQVFDNQGLPVEGLYVDRNGDGMISPDDRYIFNDPAPNAFIGFTTSVEYKKWTLSLAGRSNIGNSNYNNIWSDGGFYNRLYNSTGYLNNIHASAPLSDFSSPQYFSDFFIQDASFLRLDHITLRYDFINLFGAGRSLGVYGTFQNPLLITQYDGLDPEVFGGIDSNIYPRSRTFLLGVNVNL